MPSDPPASREVIIATETELKLAVGRRELPVLARALAARAGAKASNTQLVSTYFDTAEHALAHKGLTLRVRERDGHFVQTVKSNAGAAGLGVDRGEWEDNVSSADPDPAAPETGSFIDAALAARLVPLFRTEIGRRTIDLYPAPDTLIEAAIDRGRIYAPVSGGSEPVSEIELELKSGTATALYDMALDLLGVAAVRLEPRSKAERGYRLASAEPAEVAAVHAKPVELHRGLGGDEALRRIGIACIEQVLRNEAAVVAGLPDGIHQMRVAVRRMRAVLSAFSGTLPGEQRRALSEEARWLADELGEARNLDVFEKSFARPALAASEDPDEIEALLQAIQRCRNKAWTRAIRAVRSARYTGLLLRLLRWFDGTDWRTSALSQELAEPIDLLSARVLDRRLRAVKRRSKGFEHQTPAERHRLRIALKKLRYASEVLAGLYNRADVQGFLKRVKQLQDDLGEANDIRVGRHIVAGLASGAITEAGVRILDWHEERLAGRDRKLQKHLGRLFDTEPFWKE